MTTGFLWPEACYLRDGAAGLRFASCAEVEATLARMFPAGIPVLVSSARAGLGIALRHLRLNRGHRIAVAPYANHCVIEAVGRTSSPVDFTDPPTADAAVLYHQWGYINDGAAPAVLIEDAVDTLCRPGAGLFVRGGAYELWSLPKLVGSLYGGVIWCRNQDVAGELRMLRDQSCLWAPGHWLLRVAGTRSATALAYWSGVESTNGKMPALAIGDIAARLRRWEQLVSDHAEKFRKLQAYRPEGLRILDHRLPCVVPVAVSETQARRLTELGISTGFRHFERTNGGGRELLRLFPIPVHMDVSDATLAKAQAVIDDART